MDELMEQPVDFMDDIRGIISYAGYTTKDIDWIGGKDDQSFELGGLYLLGKDDPFRKKLLRRFEANLPSDIVIMMKDGSWYECFNYTNEEDDWWFTHVVKPTRPSTSVTLFKDAELSGVGTFYNQLISSGENGFVNKKHDA